ncbi:MAG: hypothetical protein JW729_03080 [Bacteroidales bacterium]|nr:hypothetical protein [Bacteroidales bacterium]
MKNKRKALFLLLFFVSFVSITYAVDPPPIDAGGPGGGATPLGGSAPIDGGYIISIILALSYGISIYLKKIIHLRFSNHEE